MRALDTSYGTSLSTSSFSDMFSMLQYSMYGHVRTLAEAEARGIERNGGSVDIYQVEETLPKEVLQKMYAPTEQTGHKVSILDARQSYALAVH